MKALVTFELYKIFKQKWLYLVILFLIGLNYYLMQPLTESSLRDAYASWEGPVAERTLDKATAHARAIEAKKEKGVDPTWEESNFSAIHSQIEQIVTHQQQQAAAVAHREEKMEAYAPDTYVYRTLALEKEMLSAIEYNELHYHVPAAEMTDYPSTFGLFFLGILMIIALTPMFSQEAATGVDQYIYSAKHGRRRLVHAKVIAALMVVLIVQTVSMGFNLLFWAVEDGHAGWQTAIQAVDGMWQSPYAFDLLAYFLIKTAYQTLAACAFALFVLLISALNNNPMVAFAINAGVFAFPLALNTFFPPDDISVLHVLLKFSYPSMMKVDGLFEAFETVNLFGYPVLYPIFGLGVLVVLSISVIYILYRQVIARKQVI